MNRVSKKRRKALTEIIPLPISLEDLVHEELREFVIGISAWLLAKTKLTPI
ncbi:MAG: hypothetical protein GY811_02795 [Myxococcales bacterium]|nr:hypothetical protein [Myxococcales bacterium]